MGLVVRPSQSGTGPTAYTGDAGPGLTIPVWGISADDGTTLETYVDEGGELVTVDGDGRRAGENLAGDVLLYTPSAYSDGSSVGHWDSSASPASPDDAHHQPEPAADPGPHPRGAAGRGLVAGHGSEHRGHDAGVRLHRTSPSAVHRARAQPRAPAPATGVVLDAQADPALRLVSTALDCTGGLPCALGDLRPAR